MGALKNMLFVSKLISKKAQSELVMYIAPGNQWRWEPFDIRVGQTFDHEWLTTWWACEVVAYNPKTKVFRGTYIGWGEHYDFDVDLFNPNHMNRIRRISPQSDGYSRHKALILAKPELQFERRRLYFKLSKMVEPKPNLYFSMLNGDALEERQISAVNGTRILTTDNLVFDISLDIGKLFPCQNIRQNACTFEDIVLQPYQMSELMAESYFEKTYAKEWRLTRNDKTYDHDKFSHFFFRDRSVKVDCNFNLKSCQGKFCLYNSELQTIVDLETLEDGKIVFHLKDYKSGSIQKIERSQIVPYLAGRYPNDQSGYLSYCESVDFLTKKQREEECYLAGEVKEKAKGAFKWKKGLNKLNKLEKLKVNQACSIYYQGTWYQGKIEVFNSKLISCSYDGYEYNNPWKVDVTPETWYLLDWPKLLDDFGDDYFCFVDEDLDDPELDFILETGSSTSLIGKIRKFINL